jgi:hypothetical protein
MKGERQMDMNNTTSLIGPNPSSRTIIVREQKRCRRCGELYMHESVHDNESLFILRLVRLFNRSDTTKPLLDGLCPMCEVVEKAELKKAKLRRKIEKMKDKLDKL